MSSTPGPWQEYDCDTDGTPARGHLAGDIWGVGRDGQAAIVARVYYCEDGSEANARLIAAAPELLAALTRTHHALSDIINASDNCECGARDSGDYCKCPLGSGPYKPVELQDGSGPKPFMADCNLAYAAIDKATNGQATNGQEEK